MSGVVPVTPDAPEEGALRRAGEELLAGSVIALPTDTIYGLCARALDGEAVEKLYEAKGREEEKGAPILIGHRSQLKDLARGVSPRAARLMDALWPSGLTLVLPAHPGLSPRLSEGGRGVAVRMPALALCRALAVRVGPFAATSANPPGEPPLTSAREISARFQAGVALVLDGGESGSAPPSTVVDARGEEPELMREGAVDFGSVVRAWSEAGERAS